MTDRGSNPSDPPSLADQGVGTTQVIDLADIDLSGALPEDLSGPLPVDQRKAAPPPLPPEEIARASRHPSMAPAPLPSSAPQAQLAEGRSTRFYVVVLAACLVAFVVVGALIARSTRSDAPAAAPSASAAAAKPAAARVITISPVDMNDDLDAGSAK